MVDEPDHVDWRRLRTRQCRLQADAGSGQKEREEAIGSDSFSLREAAERRAGSHDEIIVRQYLDGGGKPVAAQRGDHAGACCARLCRRTSAERLAAENRRQERSLPRASMRCAPKRWPRIPMPPNFMVSSRPSQCREIRNREDEVRIPPRRPASRPRTARRMGSIPNSRGRSDIHRSSGHRGADRRGRKDPAELSRRAGGGDANRAVSFLSQFPELAGIAPENMPGDARADVAAGPQKFARVQAMVATSEQLIAQQQQESRARPKWLGRIFMTMRGRRMRAWKPC